MHGDFRVSEWRKKILSSLLLATKHKGTKVHNKFTLDYRGLWSVDRGFFILIKYC